MELDERTSCPAWFPIFLLGMGFAGVVACQVLI